MRFKQISIGSRFELHGEVYTKVTPLLARHDSGAQKLIRQSEAVNPLKGGYKIETATGKEVVDKQAVLAAFNEFYDICDGIFAQLHATTDESALNDAHHRLKQARQRFFKKLTVTP